MHGAIETASNDNNYYFLFFVIFTRSLYDWTIPILARTWLFILGFYHIPFKGQMAKPEDAPVLVMAPHSSFFDGLIPLIFPRPFTAVTKLENRGVPLIGGEWTECILEAVNRHVSSLEGLLLAFI